MRTDTPMARPSPQVKVDPLVECDGVTAATRLPIASYTRLHQEPLVLIVAVVFNFRRKRRSRAHDAHPFCQDEKTLKTPICLIIGLTCSFLYCQWHCGQRIAPANRGNRFAHNKNVRRQFEGSGRARGRPLSPKPNRPIGANSQWDDSPQAARGYMNSDNRNRQMQPCTKAGRREATAPR